MRTINLFVAIIGLFIIIDINCMQNIHEQSSQPMVAGHTNQNTRLDEPANRMLDPLAPIAQNGHSERYLLTWEPLPNPRFPDFLSRIYYQTGWIGWHWIDFKNFFKYCAYHLCKKRYASQPEGDEN